MSESEFEQTQTRYRGTIDDRRRYPRVRIDRPAQVLRGGATPVPVTIHDVSPDGLQIRCSRTRAASLHPGARAIPKGERGETVEVVFTLALETATIPVKITGHFIYFALISPNLVALGLLCDDVSAASNRALEKLIESALEPRAAPPRK